MWGRDLGKDWYKSRGRERSDIRREGWCVSVCG